MADLNELRMHYNDTVGTAYEAGDVVFTDPMNKFIDDMISAIENPTGTDITIDCGSLASAVNAYIDLGTLA